MFKGYLEFSDTELANAERTEAYVANLAPWLPFTPAGTAKTLHIANNEPEYRSPVLDAAPWSNKLDPTTDAFYGLYPLDVVGIGDSTYSASTTESTNDGGTTQAGRSSTRDVKLSGLLVGATELATEAGLTWLRAALQQADCVDQCGGGYLRYFLAEPTVCEIAWGDEDGTSDSVSFGAATVGQTYDVRWTKIQVDPTMPSRTVWQGTTTEGTQVSFGALDRNGNVLAEETVFPLRRNYVTNPTFLSDFSGWSGSGAVWNFSGGTDGGGYVNVTSSSAPLTNFGDGVFGAGPFGATFGSTPSATAYGTKAYGSGTYGSLGSAGFASNVWATPPGVVTVSMALRGGSGATISLIDGATGAVVGSTSVQPGTDWARYSVSGVTNTTQVRVQAVDAVDIDDVLAEATDLANDYFDGSDDTLDGYTTEWLGTPNASTSERRHDGSLTTIWDSSDYQPFFTLIDGQVNNLKLTWYFREALDVQTQLLPYERTLHNVAVTQGPQVIQRIDNTRTGGGYFIQVEVLFTAGNPYSYSPTQLIATDPLLSRTYNDPSSTGALSDDWLYDPGALVPSAPPAAPDIVADAIDSSITAWQRYYVPIPADTVADWASSVPIMQIDSLSTAIRQVRVRFHPNPFGYDADQVDPLSYCADFLISYLPARTSLLMNGMVQTASATKAGVSTVAADSILFGSDGGPMTWPHLSCGIPYVMTIDVPSPADYELFDLTLQLSREE